MKNKDGKQVPAKLTLNKLKPRSREQLKTASGGNGYRTPQDGGGNPFNIPKLRN